MRVERLELLAYGHYAEKTLDLSAPASGLTIVVGPNEAGKSTARRALLSALWGFPRGPEDAYRYGAAGLRLGALVRSVGGSELHFVRQGVGRARIVDGAGNPLTESAVSGFLGGVTKDLYERLFCIDHDDLRTGSEDLLDAGGEIGRLVFGAGLGARWLGQVLVRLDARSGALYKEAGRRQRVTEALTAYNEAMRLAREARVRSRDVERRRRDATEAEGHVATVRATLEGRRTELARRERIRTALPLIARRSHLSWALEEVRREGTVATADWAERVLAAQTAAATAEEHRRAVASRHVGLQDQAAHVVVDETVLGRADQIDAVVGGLDRFKVNDEELPGSKARLEEARLRRDDCLRRVGLGPEQDDSDWVVSAAQLAVVEGLAGEHAALRQAATAATEELATLDAAISADTEELEALPEPADTEELARALKVSAPAVPRVETLATAQEASTRLRSDAGALASRLRLGGCPLDELEGLAIPSSAEITEAIGGERARYERRRQLEEQRQGLTDKRKQLSLEIESLLATPGVPDPGRLEKSRGHRDAGWMLVRQALGVGAGAGAPAEAIAGVRTGGDLGDPALSADGDASTGLAAAVGTWVALGLPNAAVDVGASSDPAALVRGLADTYEVAVADADTAADERYDHATTLSRLEQLRAQMGGVAEEEAEIAARLEALEEEQETARKEWVERWGSAGVEPGSPAEMVIWREEYGDLLACIGELRKVEEAARVEVRAITSATEVLTATLGDLGALQVPSSEKRLAMLVAQAEDIVAASTEQAQARERVQERLSRALSQRRARAGNAKKAQEELANWQASWSSALAPLRLPAETVPAAALEAARALRDLEHARRDVSTLEGQIGRMDREMAEYRSQVEEVASGLGLVDANPMTAVPALRQRRDAAREAAARRQTLEEQRDQVGTELEETDAGLEALTVTLDALREEAGCDAGEELAVVADRAKRAHQLSEQIAAIETTLVEQGAGRTLAEIVGESTEAGMDGDQLAAAALTLQEDIAQMEEQLGEAQRALGEAQNQLAAVTDSGTAADMEQDAQSHLARAATAAAEYARTAVAATVLRQVVASYGEQHQGPLLGRAGELFADVTGGAFVKLIAHPVGEQQVLFAQRRNGELCRVPQLSDGARDQLYFALRLAGIEYELSHLDEPLPVVFDDVLVNFDDPRTSAALRSLAALGERTQVLAFTHHESVVVAAQEAIDEGHLAVVRLEERDHDTPPAASGTATDGARASGSVGGRGGRGRAGTELGAAVLDVLRQAGKLMSKAEILAAAEIPEARWSQVIRRLVDEEAVVQEGEKRGARYRALGG